MWNFTTIHYQTPITQNQSKSDNVSATYRFASAPPAGERFGTLAGPQVNWLRSLPRSDDTMQRAGTFRTLSSVSSLLVLTVTVRYNAASAPFGVSLSGAPRPFLQANLRGRYAAYNANSGLITVVVNADRQDLPIPPEFTLTFPTKASRPFMRPPSARAAISMSRHSTGALGSARTKPFLRSLTFTISLLAPRRRVTAAAIGCFCNAARREPKTPRNPDVEAPLDFAPVTGWQVRSGLSLHGVFWTLTPRPHPMAHNANHLPEPVDLETRPPPDGSKTLNFARPFRVGDKC